jgi:fucose permease
MMLMNIVAVASIYVGKKTKPTREKKRRRRKKNRTTLHSIFSFSRFFFASSSIFLYVLHDKEDAARFRLSSSTVV